MTSDIREQQQFLTEQLCAMQEEMNNLHSPDEPECPPTDLNLLSVDDSIDETATYDAVLVTGEIKFRPSRMTEKPMNVGSIKKAITELENALQLFGVTVEFDNIRAVALDDEIEVLSITA